MSGEAPPGGGGIPLERARALHREGRRAEAVVAYRAALALDPGDAEAHRDLAVALQALGRDEEAIAAYRAALALRPDMAQAHNNLGALLQRRGDFQAAAGSHAAALAAQPDYPSARLNLGAALQRLGRLEQAEAAYRAVLASDPDHAAAHANLGLVLRARDRPEAALAHLDRALAAQPRSAAFHHNRGLVLRDLGEFDAATAAFARAVALAPDFAEARMSLGAARLLSGDFAGGWPDYEGRLALPGVAGPHREGPRWRGEPLDGRTVLLQGEQGLGDAIQFCRYAALVAERGARVVLSCRAPLRRLFASLAGPAAVIADTDPAPPFDAWAPLLSLPGLLGTTLQTIPSPGAYLSADPDLAERWRRRLHGVDGFRLGIVWRGSPEHGADRSRSIDPVRFSRLLKSPGARAVCLQTDARADELARLGAPVIEVGADLSDMAETAALIANLDLVVSVDTAVAHLAGALGAPVWSLIGFSPDWRWLTGRRDSPWYGSMRLFRQARRGDWATPLGEVEAALASLQRR